MKAQFYLGMGLGAAAAAAVMLMKPKQKDLKELDATHQTDRAMRKAAADWRRDVQARGICKNGGNCKKALAFPARLCYYVQAVKRSLDMRC